MSSCDYYAVLGVNGDADEKELKRSFRRLAMKYHPDRNKGNKNAETKFKEIKEAYEVLSDPAKRSAYDQYGHEGVRMHNQQQHAGQTSGFNFNDVFEDVFGDMFGSGHQQSRGSDLKYNAVLTLEEAVAGKSITVDVPHWEVCTTCQGNGAKPGTSPRTCAHCQGHGQVRMQQGFFSVQQPCPQCRGQGRVIQSPCGTCRAQGRVEKPKKLSVKIPAGIDDGDQMRLAGKGESPGGQGMSGDLYVQVRIKPHPIFSRDENNLICQVPIDFVTATLGGSLDVPTLDGKIALKIPAETQTGQSFRLRGKGVRSVRNQRVGDLICKVMVETPVNLTSEQKEILKSFQSTLDDHAKQHSPKAKNWFAGVKRFFEGIQPS